MRKILLVFGLLVMTMLSSCSVDETEIVGRWKASSEITPYSVQAHFDSDKTGIMYVASLNRLTGKETVSGYHFSWSIDGHMIVLRGQYSQQTAGEPASSETTFDARFRYSDGDLVSQGFLPGFPNLNSGLTLTKTY